MKSLKELQNATKKVLNLPQAISRQQLSEYVKVATGVNTERLDDYIEDSDYQKAYDYIIKQYSQIEILPEENEVIPEDDAQNQLPPAKDSEKGGAMAKVKSKKLVQLSDEQKSVLIEKNLQNMGFDSTETDIIELSKFINNEYTNYKAYVRDIQSAIVAYFEDQEQQALENIDNFTGKISSVIRSTNEKVSDKLHTYMETMQLVQEEQRKQREKSLQSIKERFKISTES